LPNRLTIFRVILIPFILFFMYLLFDEVQLDSNQKYIIRWICITIFTIASITDFLDGYIARKKNLTSLFGSFLDPIADKFLVISVLVMLLALKSISPVVCILIILREIYIISLRLLASHQGFQVPVIWLGKVKTTLQMIAIPFLMHHHDLWILPSRTIGLTALYLSVGLSIISAVSYSAKLVALIKAKRKKAADGE